MVQPDCATITHDVDCETAVYDFTLLPRRPRRRHSQESSPSGAFAPILFLPWDKPSLSDSLLVCFGALALSQATGILPDTGTLICGDGYRRRNVKIGNYNTSPGRAKSSTRSGEIATVGNRLHSF